MTKNIIDRIEELGLQARSPHNDGFVSFGAKKELYLLKWAIEKELNNAPLFQEENAWVIKNEP